MDRVWYFVRGNGREGPVTSAALRRMAAAGQLQATDHIWTAGMAEWEAAGRLRGLFPTAVVPAAQESEIQAVWAEITSAEPSSGQAGLVPQAKFGGDSGSTRPHPRLPADYNPNPTPVRVTVRQATWLFFVVGAVLLFWAVFREPVVTGMDLMAFAVLVLFGFLVALAVDLFTRA